MVARKGSSPTRADIPAESHSPVDDAPAARPTDAASELGPALGQRLSAALWPLAIATFAAVVSRAYPGESSYDFNTLYNGATRFLEGRRVYTDNGYVFTPSGLLLTSPMGLLERDASRLALVGVTAASSIAAAMVVLRMFGRSWRSPLAAAAVLGMALSETVVFTMVLGNVNTIVALFAAVALWAQVRGRSVTSGVALGLAVALKPISGPLLLVPLLARRWTSVLLASLVALGANVLGFVLLSRPADFFDLALPKLLTVREAFNVSLGAVGLYLDLPDAVVLAVRVAIVAVVLLTLYWSLQVRDLPVRLSVQAGALTLGLFLAGSLSETYWSILLLPLVLSVCRPASPMHCWPAWVGVYLFTSQDAWGPLPGTAEYWSQLHAPLGWLVLLLVVCAWTWRRHRESPAAAEAAAAAAVAAPAHAVRA